jgi:hypothetical protein
MAIPCIEDIDLAIENLDFLKDDLEELKSLYIDDCTPPSLERLNNSICRTVGVAGQIMKNMQVSIAAFPVGPTTSIFFPPDFCE